MLSICQQIWTTQQWPQDWKRSVSIPIPKKDRVKECSNYCMLLLISLTNKIMLKILLANHQQYGNQEFLGVQAVFQRDSGNRVQIWNIYWIMEKAKEFQKSIYFIEESLWLCGSQQTVEHSKTDGNTRPSYLTPGKPYIGQEGTEPYMEQWTDSKLGNEYVKAVCITLLI